MASIDLRGHTGPQPMRKANAAPISRRFRDAERHTRWVRRLRWLLPLLGAGAAILFVLVSVISSFLLPGISVGPISLSGSKLVMQNPKLSGFDRNKRGYEFTASAARQDVNEPKKIEMDNIKASMELTASGWVRITADRGFFDGYTESFQLENNIRAVTSLGYEVLLQEAQIDMKGGTMLSKKPVEVRYGSGVIHADALNVTDGGGSIRFEGRVRATFGEDMIGAQ